jgi:hypothetical protein
MAEKDQLYVFLCVTDNTDDGDNETFEMPCKNPINWKNNRDSSDAGCTWIAPFSLDGIHPESTIAFSVRLKVHGKYYIPVYRTEVLVGALTFHKPRNAERPRVRKARRDSIYNKASMGFSTDPNNEVNTALQLAELAITYHAERRNDYVWLRVISIYMPAPVDRIGEIYNRTGIRMCLAVNGKNVYKAHSVATLENNSRIYTWNFDPQAATVEYIPQSAVEKNTKDWDINSETNSDLEIKAPEVAEKADLKLEWTRTVFFPNASTGMADKHLSLALQRADFDAVTRRITVLSPRSREKPPLILERSVRQNVFCKLEYAMSESSCSTVVVKSITLQVDMYPKTVEDAFKIN